MPHQHNAKTKADGAGAGSNDRPLPKIGSSAFFSRFILVNQPRWPIFARSLLWRAWPCAAGTCGWKTGGTLRVHWLDGIRGGCSTESWQRGEVRPPSEIRLPSPTSLAQLSSFVMRCYWWTNWPQLHRLRKLPSFGRRFIITRHSRSRILMHAFRPTCLKIPVGSRCNPISCLHSAVVGSAVITSSKRRTGIRAVIFKRVVGISTWKSSSLQSTSQLPIAKSLIVKWWTYLGPIGCHAPAPGLIHDMPYRVGHHLFHCNGLFQSCSSHLYRCRCSLPLCSTSPRRSDRVLWLGGFFKSRRKASGSLRRHQSYQPGTLAVELDIHTQLFTFSLRRRLSSGRVDWSPTLLL